MTYRNILVPTDRSARSHRAITRAAALAAKFAARLTSLYVVPEIRDAIRKHASLRTTARAPWQAIVRAARTTKCDLIVMATHGKRGLAALGSQAMKTLAHSSVPVLVCR